MPPYGDSPVSELDLEAARRREFAIAETTVGDAVVNCVSVLTISGTMAKAADYREVPVRMVLEEQLRGTPYTYQLTTSVLRIYKKRADD